MLFLPKGDVDSLKTVKQGSDMTAFSFTKTTLRTMQNKDSIKREIGVIKTCRTNFPEVGWPELRK